MAYEQKDNSGALFKNDKAGNPKRPDYKGKLMVAGKNYQVSGWIRESKQGDKFLSLSVETEQPRGGRGSDVPF